MRQLPFPLGPPIHVRDANRHRHRRTVVHDDVASLDADGIGEVSALERYDVLGDKRSTLEAVPTQRKVSTNRAVPRSIGPHAPKSVTSSEGAQQSMYGCGFPLAISANAARTRRRACSRSRVCSVRLVNSACVSPAADRRGSRLRSEKMLTTGHHARDGRRLRVSNYRDGCGPTSQSGIAGSALLNGTPSLRRYLMTKFSVVPTHRSAGCVRTTGALPPR